MSSVLDAIVGAARRSAQDRAAVHRAEVDRTAGSATPDGPGFASALAKTTRSGVRVIAECKRRSPSRGILRRHYDPAAIASGYEAAGAAAISVLTEPSFFDGSLEHLRAVRKAVRLPLLRKDFIVTEFQITEARAAGADAVLLIVAALKDAELQGLLENASASGLAALVEVHSVDEARRAADRGAAIIGVNSRDLRTLEVKPEVFEEVAAVLPAGVVAVAESGISNPAEVIRLGRVGYTGFLIGERFMTMTDPGAALREFLAGAGAQA
jgi:indole-3-glycerol phosphate synthase